MGIFSWIPNMFHSILNELESPIHDVEKIFGVVVETVEELIKMVESAIEELENMISFNSVETYIADAIGDLFKVIKFMVTTIYGSVMDAGISYDTAVFDIVKTTIEDALKILVNTYRLMFDDVSLFVLPLSARIGHQIGAVIEIIVNDLLIMSTTIINYTTSVIQSSMNTSTHAINTSVNATSSAIVFSLHGLANAMKEGHIAAHGLMPNITIPKMPTIPIIKDVEKDIRKDFDRIVQKVEDAKAETLMEISKYTSDVHQTLNDLTNATILTITVAGLALIVSLFKHK